jgi:AraC-like DNA-binding protein/mannose-6-phosphate isomerase-like protein (cupin superfamily)
MDINKLEEYLYAETESEKWHLTHPGKLSHFYDTLPKRTHNNKEYYYFDFKNTLKTEMLGIVKESRYTVIPPHFHKDMELNYIYHGECTFIINDQKIVMKQGDVCILDSNVVHSAVSMKRKEDIVINIVFRKSYFDYVFLNRMSQQGIVSAFLLDAISRNQTHDRYILFHTEENSRIHSLIQFLLCEYYAPGNCYHELMRLYTAALFTELGNTSYHSLSQSSSRNKLLPILKYIETNYNTCTLAQTAEYFGYNANYLSNYLKKETGKSFVQIKTAQQITESAALLTMSELSINEISEQIGCSNITHFYKKFAETYHMTPGEYRLKTKVQT